MLGAEGPIIQDVKIGRLERRAAVVADEARLVIPTGQAAVCGRHGLPHDHLPAAATTTLGPRRRTGHGLGGRPRHGRPVGEGIVIGGRCGWGRMSRVLGGLARRHTEAASIDSRVCGRVGTEQCLRDAGSFQLDGTLGAEGLIQDGLQPRVAGVFLDGAEPAQVGGFAPRAGLRRDAGEGGAAAGVGGGGFRGGGDAFGGAVGGCVAGAVEAQGAREARHGEVALAVGVGVLPPVRIAVVLRVCGVEVVGCWRPEGFVFVVAGGDGWGARLGQVWEVQWGAMRAVRRAVEEELCGAAGAAESLRGGVGRGTQRAGGGFVGVTLGGELLGRVAEVEARAVGFAVMAGEDVGNAGVREGGGEVRDGWGDGRDIVEVFIGVGDAAEGGPAARDGG